MNFGKVEREAGLGRWLTEAIRSVAECEGFFHEQLFENVALQIGFHLSLRVYRRTPDERLMIND